MPISDAILAAGCGQMGKTPSILDTNQKKSVAIKRYGGRIKYSIGWVKPIAGSQDRIAFIPTKQVILLLVGTASVLH